MLRLVCGGVFAWYGAARLGLGGARRVGRVGTAHAGPVSRGWPTTMVGVLELVGGILLVLGLVTFFAALLVSIAVLAGVLLVALRREARADELTLILLAVPFALVAVGPGEWSLDDVLEFDWLGAGWALLQLGVAWLVATAATVASGREDPGTVDGESARPA